MRIGHSRRVALAAGLAAMAFLAGCGGGTEKVKQPAEGVSALPDLSATPAPVETPAPPGGALAGSTFGPACAAIPSTGPGSLEGMAKDPVATAASNNPSLSTLTRAINTARLTDSLNNAEAVTVFAPTNEAFAAADKDEISKAMADPKGRLTNLLNGHVVQGRLAPDQLVGEHRTLQGSTVTVTGSGEAFLVNDATVVCGNVQTSNATIYLIDKVLLSEDED